MQKQKQEDPFHPLGICQKLFKFITRLFSPQPKASNDQDGLVQVHFKQSEDQDSDSWTPTQNLDSSSVHIESQQEATKNKEPTSQAQVRRRRVDQPTSQDNGKKQTPKSGVTIKQREEKKTENGKITVPIDTENPKVKYQPHLISVAPNINEKSESFLKTRIEAMRRNLGLDPHDS